MADIREFKILVGNTEGRRLLGRPRRKCEVIFYRIAYSMVKFV
jgi:hypothetical protein